MERQFSGQQIFARWSPALPGPLVKKVCTRCAAFAGVLILAGCAQNPPSASSEQPLQAPIATPETVWVPDRTFDRETLYALLVAEFAGQRKRFDVMLNNYVQQAHSTQDPLVAARASRIARFLGAHAQSLEMAQLWSELDPQNPEAHYNATAELVYANRLLEATEHARKLLGKTDNTGFDAIGAQALQGGDIETTYALIEAFQQALEEAPDHVPLLIGASLLYQHAGQPEQALAAARQAAELEPDSFQASIQETRVLNQLGRNREAQEKLANLVGKHPDNQRLRLQYARSLMQTDLAGAQNQLEKLLEASPGDDDLILTLALVQYERGLLDDAGQHFSRLLQSGERRSTANYYLGRIASIQGRPEEARDHFAQVGPGVDYLPAMAQLTEIMVAEGQLDQALELVEGQRQATPEGLIEQRQGLWLLETQLLSQSGQYNEAVQLLDGAIEAMPAATQLIYTRAMLFTQLDLLKQAEADFERVLALSPDNAAALNAWGYTLVERTDRLDEAYHYISRAYRLSPDDPAVIDSMGWVEYKRGNHDKALSKLREAMHAMPDHEIAAHLGEVLWVTGKKMEAREVWRQGLKLNPESDVIAATLQRLQAELD